MRCVGKAHWLKIKEQIDYKVPGGISDLHCFTAPSTFVPKVGDFQPDALRRLGGTL